MELFILRHGHAEAYAPADNLRPLSARGRDEVKAVVEQNKTELSSVDIVWASPFLRAQQTAQIAASALGKNVITNAHLVPSGCASVVASELNENLQGASSVLLVSHLPLVGILVDELCGFEPGCYRMGTSALAAIDAEVLANACCDLRWLRHPTITV